MKLLLVEDDTAIAREVRKALEREGYTVLWLALGEKALEAVDDFLPDLIVLDLGLPDIDGVEVLKTLRKKTSAPVLILTARDALQAKISALDLGAEDYLVKPFDMPELSARLRVLARRLSTAKSSEVRIGDVTLDMAAQSIAVNEQVLTLSRREYVVAKTLIENAGRIQTRAMLEDKLYGAGEEIASNTAEVHISNLRKKLPQGFIKTIRGVGYLVNKPLISQ